MSSYEQQVIDRDLSAPLAGGTSGGMHASVRDARFAANAADERAARSSLRAQIARLERERAAIVAERFPFIAAPAPLGGVGAGAPTLLDLGALERVRDQLAADVQQLHTRVRARAEHERRAREQLQRMQLEPGRYKFARLPVRDLGQGGCGVWEVRPRLGLIGMLAGWWQLTLSSGCPLAKGPRCARPRRAGANEGPRCARPRRVESNKGPRCARPRITSVGYLRHTAAAQAGEARPSASHGVSVHGWPRFTDVSIAASVRR